MRYTGRSSAEHRLFMVANNGFITCPMDESSLDPGSFCLYEEEVRDHEADLGHALADSLLGLVHDLGASACHVTLKVEEVKL